MLAARPGSVQARQGLEAVRRAVAEGRQVYLYLYDEGVLCAGILTSLDPSVTAYACFESCRQRGIGIESPSMILCGLVTLAGLIAACDRLEAFV